MSAPNTGRPSDVTVVAYHFVMPPGTGLLARLNRLELSAFQEQLTYIKRHYTPISANELVRALDGEAPPPPRAIVLTFDDGYRCHYQHVLPLVEAAAMPALFFPVASASLDRRVLDVNKIQCVLAAANDIESVVAGIEGAIEAARHEHALPTIQEFRGQWWKASRWDSAPVAYVKRLLQHALPETVRRPLVDELFASRVSADETGFAGDLYMTADDLRDLRGRGMTVGLHGDRHLRLTTLSVDAQAREIDGALRLLDAIGASRDRFAYCYANGDHDQRSIALLRDRGCAVAFTTHPDLVCLERADRLALPRLDTNDLPTVGDAAANNWTRRAAAPSQS
jgi:peptidoglycan/xylan/chitin deacetylase (PgdA/CDA1 family)